MKWAAVFLLLLLALPCAARAQDFYGEGNVLIAVDMGECRENDDVSYPEGTMGTLVWGEGAPTGESTRSAFSFEPYDVPEGLSPMKAPEYPIEGTYEVGETLFFPYYRRDDPDYYGKDWFSADELPEEVCSPEGLPYFTISRDCAEFEDGEWWYWVYGEKTPDGQYHPCADFIELECVAVSDYSTVWRYTGIVYSNRTGFDPADYLGEVTVSDAQIKMITETCDKAYQTEEQIFGDPRFEDKRGDRDGKAAYVLLRLDGVGSGEGGFYWSGNTDSCGFDCTFLNAGWLLGEMSTDQQARQEKIFAGTLIHELNHYILCGCIGRAGWTSWLGEAMATVSVDYVWPDNIERQKYCEAMTKYSSCLRLIPGMRTSNDSPFYVMAYVLGPYFLRWMDLTATGRPDGALLTEYILGQTPEGGFLDTALDALLQETTGQSLDAWIARFMAEVVVEEAGGTYPTGSADLPTEFLLDPYTFFRDAEEYGQYLGVFDENSAADTRILSEAEEFYNLTAVEGGGTTYAYRNDEVAPIAITGAEDRWYFYAVTMDLPDPDRVIEISTGEELAKIGVDPAYPCGASYVLTGDIDLHSSEADPWTPIGTDKKPFFGTFDGGRHTIRGLFIRSEHNEQGLFGVVSGNGTIRDLTVSGSLIGKSNAGGIAGYSGGGTVTGCVSYVTVTGGGPAGGIVGRSDAGTVTNCKIFAAVTGDESIGGVVGLSDGSTVTDCESFAAVTGYGNIGGIVGYSEGSTVTDCESFAAVTGSRSSISGIVGGCFDNTTISECRNAGGVTGKRNVGAIAGTMRGDCSILNCCHTGTVSGETHVGALAGDGWDGVVTVENSYSYQPDLPAVGEDYEGTAPGCYVRSDTNTGEGLLTTAAFGDPASFPGWDFDTVWSLENGVRPVLRSSPETIVPEITAVREGDVCTVRLTDAPIGSVVVFAAYRDGQLLSVSIETYRGGIIQFSLPAGWEKAKAILADEGYRPLCAAAEVETE